MNLYIWERVDKCTASYHSEGGVLVIAETEAQAREFANAKEGVSIRKDEMPDHVRQVAGHQMVVVFPDTGC